MSWLHGEMSYKDFCTLGRNVPGVLMEILFDGRKKQFLIGDLNAKGSIAKGGRPFDDTAVVLRYKYVWQK